MKLSMIRMLAALLGCLLCLTALGGALAEEAADARIPEEAPAQPQKMAEAVEAPHDIFPEPARDAVPPCDVESGATLDWSALMLADDAAGDCAHLGSTRESITPLSTEFTSTPYAHTKVVQKRVDTICDECGAVIRSTIVTATDEPQGHRFAMGRCMDCGYVCTHIPDAAGQCLICGMWSNAMLAATGD